MPAPAPRSRAGSGATTDVRLQRPPIDACRRPSERSPVPGEPLASVDVGDAWGRGDRDDTVQTTVTDGWHVCLDEGAYRCGEWKRTVSPSRADLERGTRARPVCLVRRTS